MVDDARVPAISLLEFMSRGWSGLPVMKWIGVGGVEEASVEFTGRAYHQDVSIGMHLLHQIVDEDGSCELESS